MEDWQQQLGGFAAALITIAATIFLVWVVNTRVNRAAKKSSTATPVT